jgi:apolipoprotein N-acyltransferase
MNGIFTISFIAILLFAALVDGHKLRSAKRGQRIIYLLISLLALGFLIIGNLHIHAPLPPSFIIHTVTPWVRRLIGL